jgi:hypothetical protein
VALVAALASIIVAVIALQKPDSAVKGDSPTTASSSSSLTILSIKWSTAPDGSKLVEAQGKLDKSLDAGKYLYLVGEPDDEAPISLSMSSGPSPAGQLPDTQFWYVSDAAVFQADGSWRAVLRVPAAETRTLSVQATVVPGAPDPKPALLNGGPSAAGARQVSPSVNVNLGGR